MCSVYASLSSRNRVDAVALVDRVVGGQQQVGVERAEGTQALHVGLDVAVRRREGRPSVGGHDRGAERGVADDQRAVRRVVHRDVAGAVPGNVQHAHRASAEVELLAAREPPIDRDQVGDAAQVGRRLGRVVESVGVAELAVAHVDEPVDVSRRARHRGRARGSAPSGMAAFSAPLPPVWSKSQCVLIAHRSFSRGIPAASR